MPSNFQHFVKRLQESEKKLKCGIRTDIRTNVWMYGQMYGRTDKCTDVRKNVWTYDTEGQTDVKSEIVI